LPPLHLILAFAILTENELSQTAFVTLALAGCLDDNFGN
jgi:hypothetical protein